MKSKTKKREQSLTILEQIPQVINKITKIEDVRERRSDPDFKDFQRYVTDMKYVNNTLEPSCEVLDIGAGARIFSIALAFLGFNVTATNFVIKEGPEIHFLGNMDVILFL